MPPANIPIDTVDTVGHLSSRLTWHYAAHVLQRSDLTAHQRTMIHLRFMHALSDYEIARHCGLPVQAVREAFSRLTALVVSGEPSLLTPAVLKGGKSGV